MLAHNTLAPYAALPLHLTVPVLDGPVGPAAVVASSKVPSPRLR